MNMLSPKSRIFLSLSSLLLIATYFLPIWRIDLFAPQYPEGLTMRIWLTDIKGQIDIINGLNHYIGMREISPEMFPEFGFLIYVVGFYILFGLLAAIIGNRKILFWYLIFTAFGASFALYDFYLWGYDYGHNLDPMAAIKVPGFSYQPPIIGHKRLLNFDAYSYPDVGGWIIIIAACLAFIIWLYEWRRNKKHSSSSATRVANIAVIMLLFLSSFTSCTVKPIPFDYRTDACTTCKMGIVDMKFGNEIISTKGKVYKFDDIGCAIKYLKSGATAEKKIAQILVVNFEMKNEFLDVHKAFFVESIAVKSPMNFNVAAFSSIEAAQKFIKDKQGKMLVWDEIYNGAE